MGKCTVQSWAHAVAATAATQTRTDVPHATLTDTGCLLLISLSETLSCSACSAAECGSSAEGVVASAMQYFFTRYA
jgi:hypothetical protein